MNPNHQLFRSPMYRHACDGASKRLSWQHLGHCLNRVTVSSPRTFPSQNSPFPCLSHFINDAYSVKSNHRKNSRPACRIHADTMSGIRENNTSNKMACKHRTGMELSLFWLEDRHDLIGTAG